MDADSSCSIEDGLRDFKSETGKTCFDMPKSGNIWLPVINSAIRA